MWGSEAPARQRLWELAAEYAEWTLVSDADHLLSRDPRSLCESTLVNGWAFALYDCWDDRSHYRSDRFWRGHDYPRVWLVNPHRVPDDYRPTWSKRGIHVGHLPADFPLIAAVAPETYYIQHLAYVDAKDREAKLTRYREQFHQMTEFERAHAESIADPAPTLRVLPFAKPIKILVGGPVRKQKAILDAHLASLDAQELPARVQVTYCFVDDYPAIDPAQDSLRQFVDGRGKVMKATETRSDDFADNHPVTHQWSVTAMARVGNIKNAILRECVLGGYDYLWLVDSDLVMDRTTLKSLLAANRPVVSAVYWTRWNSDPRICAGPQVWLKPPYQLSLPHYPEHEFRNRLGVQRALERVGGLGACTLIERSVIEKGVNFSKPPDFPSGGLWDGEDRHFCEWARRLHVELWADAWPDIFHCYHSREADDLPKWEAELVNDNHPQYANIGHLVSLRLTNLEDRIGPIVARCRIGDGNLLPEIESHVMQMRRGDEKTVRVHFPVTTTPVPGLSLGGQNRLVQIELVDLKPHRLPPILRDEFFESQGGASVQDMTKLTAEQHAKMVESV